MFNYQGRLFTFGCSFTSYRWPTWADILGRKFDSFENWAQGGAGNQYIFNSLIEAYQRNSFTKNDTIIIMWSGTDREDRYINGAWYTAGDVYLNRDYYSMNYLKKYVDLRGYLIRDAATISAAKNLLDYWGVNYHFLSLMPLTTMLDDSKDYDDVIKLYKNTVTLIESSMFEVIYESNWTSQSIGHELHNITPTDNEIDQSINNRIYQLYMSLSGKNWPNFDRYINKDFIPINPFISKELKDFKKTADQIAVDYRKQIKQLSNKLVKMTKQSTRDLHPTPAEHLKYLTKNFPEWSIDEDTVKWVKQYNSKIMSKDRFEVMLNWSTKTPKNRL